MNKNTILLGALAIFLIGGIGGFALKSEYMHSTYSDERSLQQDYGLSKASGGMGMMDHSQHSMMNHDNHMMDMSVASEREFIDHMIPHHEEAVTTAKEVLARGATTPEVRSLVEAIITTQEKEIADMKSWYQEWYGEAYANKNTYTPMMRDLTKLSGAELDSVFLEDMVMHHMGAIMMAQSVKPHIEHQEITTLANAIITSQSEEIVTMRSLRNTLP
ncbi:DUF305 domain-containing protein [Patescibacteria group bacterium]|nr:DUF305 domain-containing protein [Patescibacteria group bacterium]